MAEEKKGGEKETPETPEKGKEEQPEKEEKVPKGSEKEPEKGLEEEPEKAEQPPKKVKPETRFSEGKEDEKEQNRSGYKLRKLEEENKELQERVEELERGEEPEEEIEDEDSKPVTKAELKAMIAENERKQSSEKMVQKFLKENPDYAEYEDELIEHLDHPAYRNVPVGRLANMIAGEHIMTEKEKEKADDEAEETKTGGSSKRPKTIKKKSVWDMTKEEFEAEQLRVLQNRKE